MAAPMAPRSLQRAELKDEDGEVEKEEAESAGAVLERLLSAADAAAEAAQGSADPAAAVAAKAPFLARAFAHLCGYTHTKNRSTTTHA